MGDHLKDLEKLADLKDRGVLTEAEFDAKKQALLAAGHARNSWWSVRSPKAWGAAIALAALLSAVGEAVNERQGAVDDPLTCGNSAVAVKVVELVNNQADSVLSPYVRGLMRNNGHLNVHDVVSTKQVYRNPENDQKACIAYAAGSKAISGYTLEWTDREKGAFEVQIMPPDEIIAKYGEKGRSSATDSIAATPAAPSVDHSSQAQGVAAADTRAAQDTAAAFPPTAQVAGTPQECVDQKMKAYDSKRQADLDKWVKEAQAKGEDEPNVSAGSEAMMRDDAEQAAKKACGMDVVPAATPPSPAATAP